MLDFEDAVIIISTMIVIIIVDVRHLAWHEWSPLFLLGVLAAFMYFDYLVGLVQSKYPGQRNEWATSDNIHKSLWKDVK